MDEHALGELIGQIYGAATDEGQMAQLAPVIAREFGRHSAVLYLHRKPTPLPQFVSLLSSTPENHDPAALKAYAQYYHSRDEWFSRGMKRPPGSVIMGSELIDDNAFACTEFYNDFCRHHGGFHVLAATVPVAEGILGAIGIHGLRRHHRFDESHRARLAFLLPHLQRAFQIHHRLRIAERNSGSLLGILTGLNVGAIIVDQTGRVLFANEIGERALERERGIRTWRGRLQAERPSDNSELERMIGAAARARAGCAGDQGGVVRLDSASGETLRLLVAPLYASSDRFGTEQPAALVIFSDVSRPPALRQDVLASAFGLTRAEARLAAALAGGDDLAAYAGRNKISRHTAKDQLKQVFAKVGVSRQAELVARILLDPVLRDFPTFRRT
jgi:DNA-binding CsgD family transcriptional regulator